MRNILLVVALVILFPGLAAAQGSAFSYQGRLSEAGSPVSGTRYFRFTLFDENGSAIPGAIVEQTLTVTNGVFNTSLDFGAAAFPGANRTLQISVKINAGDPFTDLMPRQDILAAPYSIKSKTAENAALLGGVDSSGFVQQDAGGNVSITGGLTIAGTFTLDTVNATTQYNLGGQRILSSGGTGNLFAGISAGAANTTGINNSFFGRFAGQANTSGSANSFFGTSAGLNNREGNGNTAVGSGAGLVNETGSSNTFVGNVAGFNNTASFNTFIGAEAGLFSTTGSSNTFVGMSSGKVNTGNGNSFFGRDAGRSNTASGNSFFGYFAGRENTTGSLNAFFGIGAGANNTTACCNSFFGNDAGRSNTTGGANTFFGGTTGGANTTGGYNAFFGDFTGISLASGDGNTFVGAYTAQSVTTGNYNSVFGNNITVGNNLTYAAAIGAGAAVNSSDTIVLGKIAGTYNAVVRPADRVLIPGSLTIGDANTTAPTTRLQIRTASGNYGFTQTDGAITVGSYVGGSSSGATGGWLGTLTNNKLFFFTNGGQPSMTVETNGNVGIGTVIPTSKFTVAGLIESTTGGVKFPDGTIQTTASTGGGSGVTSLNGLTGNLSLAAGSNITITPTGNTLTIASTGGAGGGILNQTTLQANANFSIDGNGAATTFTVNGIAVLRAKNDSISFGRNAGALANSADDNVFIGTRAGQNNNSNNNVYIGFNAGRDNVSGGGNVFVGDQAGAFGASGQRNVFVGQNTGFFNTGNNNAFFGTDAGSSTTGSNNVFVGTETGTNNLRGSNNVFVGYKSAEVNTTGNDNTVIGSNAGMQAGSTNLTNTTVVGANATVSQSNSVILGNNASVGIGTTQPKAKLDVRGGNILVGSPGQGIILKSPDGATCKQLSIDNAGAMVLTAVACP